ncbi:MAG: type II secretion system protein GspG [Acidobacteria bacterium]|nr:type II secretion system protein GspG [Acidobacteriota bacterium]
MAEWKFDESRRQSGFTLIELLIVVTIIGIIAAIAIPQLQNALDRTKQKSTMADMRVIGQSLEMYATDHNVYPRGLNDVGASTISGYITPIYLRKVPPGDGWKNPWHIDTNAFGTIYTITSYGKDGVQGPNTGGPVTRFVCDIIYTNSSFYQWPGGAQQ